MRARGGPVLELGCGTGRVTAPLAAQTGAVVVGLDIDPEMLAVARTRYDGPLLCGDMRRFAFHSRFPVVVIPFSSLQELDGAGRRECLAHVAAHLADEGVLALEVTDLPIEALASVEVEPVAAGELDGVSVLLSAGLVVDDSRVIYQRRFDVSGDIVASDVTLHTVTRDVIVDEAAAAGIGDIAFYLDAVEQAVEGEGAVRPAAPDEGLQL